MPFRVAVVALACLMPACSLARSTIGPGDPGADARSDLDAAALDAPGLDGGELTDAARSDDAATLDDATVEPIDAAVELVDAAPDPVDAFVPPVDASRGRSCTENYGTASNYAPCSDEYAVNCVFYVRLGGASCETICPGNCQTAYNNGPTGSLCMYDSASDEDTCGSTHTDELCVCARVP